MPLIEQARVSGRTWWEALLLSGLAFVEYTAGDHVAVDRTLMRMRECQERTVSTRCSRIAASRSMSSRSSRSTSRGGRARYRAARGPRPGLPSPLDLCNAAACPGARARGGGGRRRGADGARRARSRGRLASSVRPRPGRTSSAAGSTGGPGSAARRRRRSVGLSSSSQSSVRRRGRDASPCRARPRGAPAIPDGAHSDGAPRGRARRRELTNREVAIRRS